mmetsp:Transcript_97729/g.232715  ORF Transcript_97729/g.232715 Transcript_97729/m.232715 type:complete len:447 (-) Transcript_97729:491-1831(-)
MAEGALGHLEAEAVAHHGLRHGAEVPQRQHGPPELRGARGMTRDVDQEALVDGCVPAVSCGDLHSNHARVTLRGRAAEAGAGRVEVEPLRQRLAIRQGGREVQLLVFAVHEGPPGHLEVQGLAGLHALRLQVACHEGRLVACDLRKTAAIAQDDVETVRHRQVLRVHGGEQHLQDTCKMGRGPAVESAVLSIEMKPSWQLGPVRGGGPEVELLPVRGVDEHALGQRVDKVFPRCKMLRGNGLGERRATADVDGQCGGLFHAGGIHARHLDVDDAAIFGARGAGERHRLAVEVEPCRQRGSSGCGPEVPSRLGEQAAGELVLERHPRSGADWHLSALLGVQGDLLGQVRVPLPRVVLLRLAHQGVEAGPLRSARHCTRGRCKGHAYLCHILELKSDGLVLINLMLMHHLHGVVLVGAQLRTFEGIAMGGLHLLHLSGVGEVHHVVWL